MEDPATRAVFLMILAKGTLGDREIAQRNHTYIYFLDKH